MHHLLYSLYLLPLLALALFIFLPFSQALTLYFPILVLYSIFYWVAWKDRHRPVTLGVEGMIGGVARVMENRAGQVKVFYRGEIWGAVCTEPVAKDEKVEITGMDQMKLLVRPGRKREQME
jgi:membrane protein implicated in regulation of membrane protease activity